MNDKLSPYDLMKFMTSNFDYSYDEATAQYMVDGRPLDENMVNHLLAYIGHNLDPSITRRRLLVGIKRHGDSPCVCSDDDGMHGAKVQSVEVPTDAHQLIKDHVKPYDGTVANTEGNKSFMTVTDLKMVLHAKYKAFNLSTIAIGKILRGGALNYQRAHFDKKRGFWLRLEGLGNVPETQSEEPGDFPLGRN